MEPARPRTVPLRPVGGPAHFTELLRGSRAIDRGRGDTAAERLLKGESRRIDQRKGRLEKSDLEHKVKR